MGKQILKFAKRQDEYCQNIKAKKDGRGKGLVKKQLTRRVSSYDSSGVELQEGLWLWEAKKVAGLSGTQEGLGAAA